MDKIRIENVNRTGLHDLFESYFPIPYGRTLDALYDYLSWWDKELTIELDESSLQATLEDRYYDKLLRMLRDAAEENPKITLVICA